MPPFPPFKRKRVVVLQERPEVRRGRQNILKRARHDANNRVGTVVEPNLATNDGAVATKASSPQAVTKNHDARAIQAVIARVEILPQGGQHPQAPKIAGTDALSVKPFRLGFTGQSGLPEFAHREGVERLT